MFASAPIDGFRLAFDRRGSGAGVVLLHGWPGDHGDYRELTPLLAGRADVIVPDLRGFAASRRDPAGAVSGYGADGQARSVAGLIEELGVAPVVLAGYDVGSRVAQALARARPELVRALVIAPPVPGAGDRVLSETAQREFWYQAFHRLGLVEELVDGDAIRVRAYLRHFWSHWSGPSFELGEDDLERLAAVYGAPGAFSASVAWYRSGSGMVASSLREGSGEGPDPISVPTTVLWPEQDPLFPVDWSDRLDRFFDDVRLRPLPGVGHFVPLEAPRELAGAIQAALGGA